MNDRASSPSSLSLEAFVRTLQIIIGALCSGIVLFLAMVFSLARNEPVPGGMLSMVGVGIAVAAVASAFVLPGIVVAQHRRRIVEKEKADGGDRSLERRLLDAYQVKLIMAGALLEGAALLNVVVFLLEGQWYNVAIGLLLATGIALLFPTRSRLDHWIEEQKRWMDNERAMQRSP